MTSQFFEAVLFDMDGLTINSEPQWLEAERELASQFGYEWTVEDQAYCLGGPLSKLGQYMSDRVNGAKDGTYFHHRIIEVMAEKVRQQASYMDGAREFIGDLISRRIPLALVSASPRVIVDAALTHMNPIPFRITISADDVKQTKPNPEGYLLAAERLNVRIENCLILEDSATGVSAARASGAKVIAIPQLVKIDEDAQTKIFKSLIQLDFKTLQELHLNW